jgi:hypothetical protein
MCLIVVRVGWRQVGKAVSRHAQEQLNNHSVVLMQHVKPQVSHLAPQP